MRNSLLFGAVVFAAIAATPAAFADVVTYSGASGPILGIGGNYRDYVFGPSVSVSANAAGKSVGASGNYVTLKFQGGQYSGDVDLGGNNVSATFQGGQFGGGVGLIGNDVTGTFQDGNFGGGVDLGGNNVSAMFLAGQYGGGVDLSGNYVSSTFQGGQFGGKITVGGNYATANFSGGSFVDKLDMYGNFLSSTVSGGSFNSGSSGKFAFNVGVFGNIDFVGSSLTLIDWTVAGTLSDGTAISAAIANNYGQCIRFNSSACVANTVVVLPPTPPVPEPATWALALAGLGLFAAQRLRRAEVAPTR